MLVDIEVNVEFIVVWYEFIGDDVCVINDLMEVYYIGFNMWVQIVIELGIIDVEEVIVVLLG